MSLTAILTALVSFGTTFYVTPWLIRYLRKIGLVVKDQNKPDKPLIPISGGMAVLGGILAGLMFFLFSRTFFPESFVGIYITPESLNNIFAVTISILIICIVGFVDDLLVERSKNRSSGLRQWQKPLLTLFAAVPLMVISLNHSTIELPNKSQLFVGILYPLLFVPVGVMGAANMVNLLGGLNGLEAGLGLIYIGTLGLYAYVNGRYIAAFIALLMLFSLAAFYFYNKYPAKIFPGDSLTYLLGATLAAIAITGHMEGVALIASIPFIIEFILKLRSRLKAQSFGTYQEGKLISKYTSVYSLTHLFMNGRFTETQITFMLICIQLIISNIIWLF